MGIWGNKNKSIGQYKILERYPKGVDGCKLIGETSEYIIYTIRESWILNRHFLRQDKSNPNKVVYLGEAHDNIAILHNRIFSMNHRSLKGLGLHPLYETDIKTGKRVAIPFLSEKVYREFRCGGGTVNLDTYCQDEVNSITVEDNTLILNVTRYKENSEREKEFTYIIHLYYVGETLKMKRFFPECEFPNE